MLTERDHAVLHALARYYVLSREQISRLCFPSDKSGRITRRRLQMLLDAGFINRTNAPLYNPRGGDPWPAYFPSKRGGEHLAEVTGDDRFLAVPFQTPFSQHLEHWIAIAETHIALETAIAGQSVATLDSWVNEWDIVNLDETAPEKRYRLYTLFQPQPRLVCAPDAAFLLSARGHVKVFYLEQDRNTSGARQVAASKSKGYAALAQQQLHRRHFPSTTLDSFSVLTITTTAQRRDALRKAFRDVPAPSLWKFACIAETTPENFLFANIWHPTVGEPTSIIKPEVVQSTATAEPPAS